MQIKIVVDSDLAVANEEAREFNECTPHCEEVDLVGEDHVLLGVVYYAWVHIKSNYTFSQHTKYNTL